jgi:hypothetical protein
MIKSAGSLQKKKVSSRSTARAQPIIHETKIRISRCKSRRAMKKFLRGLQDPIQLSKFASEPATFANFFDNSLDRIGSHPSDPPELTSCRDGLQKLIHQNTVWPQHKNQLARNKDYNKSRASKHLTSKWKEVVHDRWDFQQHALRPPHKEKKGIHQVTSVYAARTTRRRTILWLLRLQHCRLRLTMLGGLTSSRPRVRKITLKTCNFVDISNTKIPRTLGGSTTTSSPIVVVILWQQLTYLYIVDYSHADHTALDKS